jgi:hypothetical protein
VMGSKPAKRHHPPPRPPSGLTIHARLADRKRPTKAAWAVVLWSEMLSRLA